MAAALAGGAAGLVAGTACVAWPPAGRQGAAPPWALPPSKVPLSQEGQGARQPDARGVATVLAPAADAGVFPPRARDDVAESP